MRAAPIPSTSRLKSVLNLGDLPGLSTATTLSNITQAQKSSIIDATSQICKQLMRDLGVKWKPQPVDPALRRRTMAWIKTDLQPILPIDKRFLLSVDAGITYTERVYEGGDFETKCSMVKYASVAIYLDDLIDKDAQMAKEAESFLVKMLLSSSSSSSSHSPSSPSSPSSSPPAAAAVDGEDPGLGLSLHQSWLNQYRLASLELAAHMSDPFVSNMMLHSCTLFIEGCALEYHIQRDEAKYFLVRSAEEEMARDEEERMRSPEEVPMPLDADWIDAGAAAVVEPAAGKGGEGREGGGGGGGGAGLVPHGWPIWLRERSAVSETFAITSFRAPYGIDIPTWVWVTAISELRTIILSINDVLSFAKELIADDTTSSIAVLTKERRMIGMPGTAEDGGWCLRDTFDEVCGKILVAGARINRLLRPARVEARYAADGRAYTVEELAKMIKAKTMVDGVSKEDRTKALALKLWETHQRGYVAWHFQSPRYRTHELFDWVGDMMGGGEIADAGPEWITSCF